jgi:hypothetical protein
MILKPLPDNLLFRPAFQESREKHRYRCRGMTARHLPQLTRNSIIQPYAQIARARNLSLWRAKQAHNFADSGQRTASFDVQGIGLCSI